MIGTPSDDEIVPSYVVVQLNFDSGRFLFKINLYASTIVHKVGGIGGQCSGKAHSFFHQYRNQLFTSQIL